MSVGSGLGNVVASLLELGASLLNIGLPGVQVEFAGGPMQLSGPFRTLGLVGVLECQRQHSRLLGLRPPTKNRPGRQSNDSQHSRRSDGAFRPLLPGEALLDLGNRLGLFQRFAADRAHRARVPRALWSRAYLRSRADRAARINLAPVFGSLLFQKRHLDDAAAFGTGGLFTGQLGVDLNLCVAVGADEFDLLLRRGRLSRGFGVVRQCGGGELLDIGRPGRGRRHRQRLPARRAPRTLARQAVLDVELLVAMRAVEFDGHD